MSLVEFTRFNGTKIAINPEYVIHIAPSTIAKDNTVINLNDGTFEVKESYDTVFHVLTGTAFGRDERGRFAKAGV